MKKKNWFLLGILLLAGFIFISCEQANSPKKEDPIPEAPPVEEPETPEVKPYYVKDSVWRDFDLTTLAGASSSARLASGDIVLSDALILIDEYNATHTDNKLFLNTEEIPIEEAPTCELWIVDKDTYALKKQGDGSDFHIAGLPRTEVLDRREAWRMDCAIVGNGVLYVDIAPPPERVVEPPIDLRTDDEKYIIYLIQDSTGAVVLMEHCNETWPVPGYSDLDAYFTFRVYMFQLECAGRGTGYHVISGEYYTEPTGI